MSAYLDRTMAIGAFELVRETIEFTLANVAKRNAGHLRISVQQPDGGWETILTEDFGNPLDWEHDYVGHATGKEKLSQKHGMSSREVHAMFPDLIEVGDTVYYGSVASPGGNIVVAFSGVEAYFDEMIAQWVLTTCLAMVQQKLEQQKSAGKEFYAAY